MLFGEIVKILGHALHHFLVWLHFPGDHLSKATLNHVLLLQRQERHIDVHQVLVNQSGMPETA